MTELEQKLLAENEALKRENAKLKRNIASAEIEIIDEKHVKFNGQIFHENNYGYYSRNMTLHEAVWRFHFGNIPEGYVVHHINEIKTDNRIENLQLMTTKEHRAWHNQNSKITFFCDYCGREVQKSSTSRNNENHFCSRQCRSRYVEENKIYYEDRICVTCGKTFSVSRFRKQKNCSRECGRKSMSATKRGKPSGLRGKLGDRLRDDNGRFISEKK